MSTLCFLVFGTIGLTARVPVSHATTAPAASLSVCGLRNGLQKFFDNRTAGNFALELDARKGLLYIVADCSKEETQDAIDTLLKLNVDGILNQSKMQLIERLKERRDRMYP